MTNDELAKLEAAADIALMEWSKVWDAVQAELHRRAVKAEVMAELEAAKPQSAP
jgi:hypothetical protein